MSRDRRFNILIVRGSRITRLDVPRWTIPAVLALASAMLSFQTFVVRDYLALRRQAVQLAALEERTRGQRALEAAVERGISGVTAELAQWAEVQDRVWRAMAAVPRRGRSSGGVGGAGPAAEREDDAEAPLETRLERLVASVREEGQKLRALGAVMIRNATILTRLPSRWPLVGRVNSEFGHRPSPWSGAREFHDGIDIGADVGSAVRAPAPGVVAEASRANGYGTTLVLDHGQRVRTRFAHLQAVRVTPGQRVERGDVIALSGNTGRSTGPHLHYEVLVDGRSVNPRSYIWE